jgi:hypothetical protein
MTLFELNLNTSISLKNENDIDFTCESSAILSLIDYCNLKVNNDFKCFIYYDPETIDEKIIFEILNRKFENYKFLSDEFEHKTDQNLIFVREINSNRTNVNDTNLPSLIRRLNHHLTLTITGLASVFRTIVKESQKLKSNSNSNINYLLVNFFSLNLNFCFHDFLFARFKNRVLETIALKHVQKYLNGLIYVKLCL